MKDIHQTITDYILNNIDEAGEWKPCWQGMTNSMPHNAVSGHRYNGTNIITCWVSQMIGDYSTQQWASYKQWQSVGAQVRKGERGTPILYYNKVESEDPEKDGLMFARGSHVFNLDQVDGAPASAEPEPRLSVEQRSAAIEEWIEAVSNEAMIEERAEGRAYYRPSTDTVVMPFFTDFETPEHYYSVLFHELTHWTGARHRLDREFRREKTEYAKEELVAEIGAAFLAADFGIENVTRDDHLSYLKSWMKVLRDDKRLIVRAASLAGKANDYLHNLALAHSHVKQAA